MLIFAYHFTIIIKNHHLQKAVVYDSRKINLAVYYKYLIKQVLGTFLFFMVKLGKQREATAPIYP